MSCGYWRLFNFLFVFCPFFLSSLVEVNLHVSLKIEVGKLILLSELEKLGKLGIGVDDAAIVLVLKLVLLDVSVNLLADSGSSHLGSNLLSKESGELVTDRSGA